MSIVPLRHVRTIVAACMCVGLIAAEGAAEAKGNSQVVCALGPGSTQVQGALRAPSAHIAAIATSVQRALCPSGEGCGSIQVYRNDSVPNAITMPRGDRSSIVVYSGPFMQDIRAAYGGDAAIFGILAHEAGHHMDRNAAPFAKLKRSWNAELRADAWAGCAIARAHLRENALVALRALASSPSPSHPDLAQREQAVRFGFDACNDASAPSPREPAIPNVRVVSDTEEDDDDAEDEADPCATERDACVASAPSLDACLTDFEQKLCPEACRKSFGYSRKQCADFCSRSQPANRATWTRSCERKTASARDACDRAFHACTAR